MKYEKLLVVDFEMTCWGENPVPDGMYPEIVQIGIVEIDLIKLKINREIEYFVRPEISELTPFFHELTGLTKKQIYKQGMTLEEAGRLIRQKYGSLNKPWMAWGRDDKQHDMEIVRKNLQPFFSDDYYNLSGMFTMMHGDRTRKGLAANLERWGLTPEGNAHNALVDAKNTAKLALEFLKTYDQSF